MMGNRNKKEKKVNEKEKYDIERKKDISIYVQLFKPMIFN